MKIPLSFYLHFVAGYLLGLALALAGLNITLEAVKFMGLLP